MNPLREILNAGIRILIENEVDDDSSIDKILPLPMINDLFMDDSDDDQVENVAVNTIIKVAESFVQKDHRTCTIDYTSLIYTDLEFVVQFRLKRTLVMNIVNRFDNWPGFSNLGGYGGFKVLSAEKHILTFLWYAGHQNVTFRNVANKFDLSLSALESVLQRVTQFLCDIRNEVIQYPTKADKLKTQRHYLNSEGFPRVIGTIDSSHVRVDKPEDPLLYINKKHYFSVHMQGTINEKKKFIDVYVGHPGSVHDAKVFATSHLAEDLPALCEAGTIFLGNATYPCLPQLITPYKDDRHLTQAQRNFNRIHNQCMISAEDGFKMLKQRFRQLYCLKLKKMKFIVEFIFACCVLHNLADLDDLQYLEQPEDDDHADMNARALLHCHDVPAADSDEEPADDQHGCDVRDELCRQLQSEDDSTSGEKSHL